jgi:beta-N-acetylhexosaminidase
MPIEEAVIAAVRAGMDMVEICHSPALILSAFEALLAEGERSAAFEKLLLKRATRMERARAELFSCGTAQALTARQFELLRARILRFRETITKAQESHRG